MDIKNQNRVITEFAKAWTSDVSELGYELTNFSRSFSDSLYFMIAYDPDRHVWIPPSLVIYFLTQSSFEWQKTLQN